MTTEKGNKQLELAGFILTCVTFVITLVTAIAVYKQTTNYFKLERTSYFIERFNQTELVEARRIVDDWIDSKDTAHQLFKRARLVRVER